MKVVSCLMTHLNCYSLFDSGLQQPRLVLNHCFGVLEKHFEALVPGSTQHLVRMKSLERRQTSTLASSFDSNYLNHLVRHHCCPMELAFS